MSNDKRERVVQICSDVDCDKPGTRTHPWLESHGKVCCEEHGKILDEMYDDLLKSISRAGRSGAFAKM